jgi:hypothetical protein
VRLRSGACIAKMTAIESPPRHEGPAGHECQRPSSTAPQAFHLGTLTFLPGAGTGEKKGMDGVLRRGGGRHGRHPRGPELPLDHRAPSGCPRCGRSTARRRPQAGRANRRAPAPQPAGGRCAPWVCDGVVVLQRHPRRGGGPALCLPHGRLRGQRAGQAHRDACGLDRPSNRQALRQPDPDRRHPGDERPHRLRPTSCGPASTAPPSPSTWASRVPPSRTARRARRRRACSISARAGSATTTRALGFRRAAASPSRGSRSR